MKKMPKFSKLENGDTFYYQINNYSKELDGRYMIFIATGDRTIQPTFRVKVTSNNKLPQTQIELENLKYARIETRIWEKRFFPLSGKCSTKELIKERSKTKFFPDENGILYIYQVGISGKTIRSVPEEWNYLGKFELSVPSDEYIPFEKLDIWGFIWDYRKEYGRNAFKSFIDRYLRYNGKSKDYIELIKKNRKQEQQIIRTIIAYCDKNEKDIDKIMDIITTIK